MTRTLTPNCPQPETPIRDRAWMDDQLEVISNKIRCGEPVDILEAIAAIEYQARLQAYRESRKWWRRLSRWLSRTTGAKP